MPRRKLVTPQLASQPGTQKRARRVPVIIISHTAPPASHHIVDLKTDAPAHPLLSVEPVRPAALPPLPSGFSPNLDAFRSKAAVIRQEETPTTEVYTITPKPVPAFQPVAAPTIEAIQEDRQEIAREERITRTQRWYHSLGRTYRLVSFLRKEVAIGFTIASLVLTMPIYAFTNYPELAQMKDDIMHKGNSAVTALQESKDALAQGDMSHGGALLISALTSFQEAKKQIDSIGTLGSNILSLVPVVGSKFKTGKQLLTASESLTIAASQLLYAQKDAPTSTPTDVLAYWHTTIEHVYPTIHKADKALLAVDAAKLPADIAPRFGQLAAIVHAASQDLALFLKTTPSVLEALGATTPKRYLIVFQNSSELRATGGFIGSYALLDLSHGTVKNLEIPKGGSYDLKGQLSAYSEPPLPLYLVNNRWEFQDANWYPDFPTTAQNLMWFYEHAGGPTVDGVIAVNDQLIPGLLRVLGTVQTPSGLRLDADTFFTTLSAQITAARQAKSKTPKAVIGELAPVLLERMKQATLSQKLGIAQVVSDALADGEVLFWSSDSVLQDTIQNFGWDGRLQQTKEDYLHVNLSNIGGQKSDTNLSGRIEHQAWIQPDGTIIDTVSVIRTHEGVTSEESNINYARFYVPKGSELLEAVGFNYPAESDFHAPLSYVTKNELLGQTEKEIGYHEASGTRITEEFGKTVFGNWIVTKPHQTNVVRITYRTPVRAFSPEDLANPFLRLATKAHLHTPAFHYAVLVQRQPGTRAMTVQSHVLLPSTWQATWYTPNDHTQQFSDGMKYEAPFTHDLFFGLLAEQK